MGPNQSRPGCVVPMSWAGYESNAAAAWGVARFDIAATVWSMCPAQAEPRLNPERLTFNASRDEVRRRMDAYLDGAVHAGSGA